MLYCPTADTPDAKNETNEGARDGWMAVFHCVCVRFALKNKTRRSNKVPTHHRPTRALMQYESKYQKHQGIDRLA